MRTLRLVPAGRPAIMPPMVVRRAVALLATSTMVVMPAGASAAPGECHVVDVEFQPASRTDLPAPINRPPQIVVWVEDTAGQYVDTIFITNETGRRGLGNRPGRWDFNSGPLWPYGRRITTLPECPVWKAARAAFPLPDSLSGEALPVSTSTR